MTAGSNIHRIEMSDAEIESLLQKAGTAALAPEEVEKLRNLVATLKYVTAELEKKHVSLHRLKSMLFGAQSERTSTLRLTRLLARGAEAAQALGKQADAAGDNRNDGGSPDAASKGNTGTWKGSGNVRRYRRTATGSVSSVELQHCPLITRLAQTIARYPQ